MARVRAAFSIAFQLNAFQEHLGSKRRAHAVSTSIISTPLPPCCTSVHDADLPGDSEAPMRPERWRRRTVVASLLREISGLYNAAQLEKGPNPPPRADDHRQLSPQDPVSSHEVTDLIELLSERRQRVPNLTIRPNEIKFLPRRGHTRVPKIRKLIKFSGWETPCVLKYTRRCPR